MRLSADGRTLLQKFEGLSLRAYRDGPGWSIGYGHYLGTGNAEGKTIDRAEAERLFNQDTAATEALVSVIARSPLQHEFDAMVSLAYNIGAGGFKDSTVLRLHNAGDRLGAADAFRMWNKSQGQVLKVLVDRREKERGVYLNGYSAPGSYPQPLPPMTTPEPNSIALPALPNEPTESEPGWTAPELAPPGGGWTPAVRTASISSVVTAAALGIGWLLYRLLHR